MDAHESVKAKVQTIFRGLAGDRAEVLRGEVNARAANDVLGEALAAEMPMPRADELAFHMVDWNADAAFVVAAILYPEKFTAEELRAGVDMFLIHAPAHVLAAARLAGHEAKDIFSEDAT